MHVNVVKAYAPTGEFAFVIAFNNVDFPTEGNPTMVTVASPLLLTENPSPLPFPEAFFTCSSFIFANFAFTKPMWPCVFLFYFVVDSSSSNSFTFLS